MSSTKNGSPLTCAVTSYYPQSLTARQGDNPLEDTDALSPQNTYFLRPSERLEVGKYVPDALNKDPANPKYAGGGDSTPRTPSSSRTATSSGATPLTASTDDADFEDVDDADSPAGGEEILLSSSGADVAKYCLIQPSGRYTSQLAGSLFFPVHYPVPTAKDRADPRGLPQAINEAMHPNDRAGWNLATYCVKGINLNKLMLFKIGPGAVAFRVVINAFEVAGMKYTPSNQHFSVLWAKRATPAILGSLHPYQKVNHFPGTWGIGRKDSLATNVGKMKRQYGAAAFNIVPASFILPREKDELAEDLQDAMAAAGVPPTYIVKPSASSCGRGIKLYRGMPPMPKAGGKTFVCQRYIGNPFLVQQRKFDLRMYCVVTGFDPLKIFLFDEGLVRFAAEKYPGEDKGLENSYMHLTNYSVSKTAELNRASRGKSEDTDDPVDIKWCLTDFMRWLKSTHGEEKGGQMWDAIMTEVHDVVIKTFLSIESDVVARLRSECSDPTGRNCFELYGLDLMVDSNLSVKLIEVNIMPSLATGTTLDKAVKARMIAHMLTLARPIPFCRDAPTGAGATFTPAGPYTQGVAAERYYYPTCRGAPRGPVERNNVALLTRFNHPAVPESMLSPHETLMLLESDEELRCAGGFRRIFPCARTSMKYFPYFTQGVSRNNYLLASWAEERERQLK